MIKLSKTGVYLYNNSQIFETESEIKKQLGIDINAQFAMKGTMAYQILSAHNQGDDMMHLKLKYDAMASHDITTVAIIQTAVASGMKEFPLPYVMTNCHNTLCAVGGTINEDDHKFALSAAQKYGGIYVPPGVAVIHSYNREVLAKAGRMVLSTDSHTRYGALGAMGTGEGGGELVKQLLGQTYDIDMPEIIAVYLDGALKKGVGAHDVALSLVGAVYESGYAKNKVLEFVGPGVSSLPVDYRNDIDAMTTETTCWSSIWATDEKTKEFYRIHGREEDYKKIEPEKFAYYSGCVYINLSEIENVIAMPMHPSNVYTIHELMENAEDILAITEEKINRQISGASIDLRHKYRNGDLWIEQGEIAGCTGGTFTSLCAAADIVRGKSIGNGNFSLNIYPGSLPIYSRLVRNGCADSFINAGAIIRECFCGPCFGSGDCPANGEFSIRHSSRNFPNREGSKPGDGQLSVVALMDALSIAATAANGGRLTAATDLDVEYKDYAYEFNNEIYNNRIYNGWQKPDNSKELKFGPNIKPWPVIPSLSEDLLLKVCSYITNPVTTTDELLPSGEASSYRSNPEKLAEFALCRCDEEYVGRSKRVLIDDRERAKGNISEEYKDVFVSLEKAGLRVDASKTNFASTIYAHMPGDGSAREQAASCQRILGAEANIARQYATKRYRSNCINWGMIPFITDNPEAFELNDYIFVPGIRRLIENGEDKADAYAVNKDGQVTKLSLSFGPLTAKEREILIAGCLINSNRLEK